MPCRATQDGQIRVESSDKMWSTEEGNGKLLQYSCLENPVNNIKRVGKIPWKREWKTTSLFLSCEPHKQYEKAKYRTLKDELPRSVGAQYATEDQWRNKSRKNEEMETKQKQQSVVDVTGDGGKVQRCKEQYCIGT